MTAPYRMAHPMMAHQRVALKTIDCGSGDCGWNGVEHWHDLRPEPLPASRPDRARPARDRGHRPGRAGGVGDGGAAVNSTIADSLPSTTEISEALHETAREYGLVWAVDEQVAVARYLRKAELSTNRGRLPRKQDVVDAFEAYHIAGLRRGFASAVVARLSRLYGPRRVAIK